MDGYGKSFEQWLIKGYPHSRKPPQCQPRVNKPLGCFTGGYHFSSHLSLSEGTTTINQPGFLNPGLTLWNDHQHGPWHHSPPPKVRGHCQHRSAEGRAGGGPTRKRHREGGGGGRFRGMMTIIYKCLFFLPSKIMGIWYDMIWYDWYDMIWYDMIWYGGFLK